MLKEYFELTAQIEALEEQKRDLREKLIKKGTHSSRDFICEVKEQTRRSISLTEIAKESPSLAKDLEQRGLIKSSTSMIVKVTQKKVA